METWTASGLCSALITPSQDHVPPLLAHRAQLIVVRRKHRSLPQSGEMEADGRMCPPPLLRESLVVTLGVWCPKGEGSQTVSLGDKVAERRCLGATQTLTLTL